MTGTFESDILTSSHLVLKLSHTGIWIWMAGMYERGGFLQTLMVLHVFCVEPCSMFRTRLVWTGMMVAPGLVSLMKSEGNTLFYSKTKKHHSVYRISFLLHKKSSSPPIGAIAGPSHLPWPSGHGGAEDLSPRRREGLRSRSC